MMQSAEPVRLSAEPWHRYNPMVAFGIFFCFTTRRFSLGRPASPEERATDNSKYRPPKSDRDARCAQQFPSRRRFARSAAT